jgi:hypothetical protein
VPGVFVRAEGLTTGRSEMLEDMRDEIVFQNRIGFKLALYLVMILNLI